MRILPSISVVASCYRRRRCSTRGSPCRGSCRRKACQQERTPYRCTWRISNPSSFLVAAFVIPNPMQPIPSSIRQSYNGRCSRKSKPQRPRSCRIEHLVCGPFYLSMAVKPAFVNGPSRSSAFGIRPVASLLKIIWSPSNMISKAPETTYPFKIVGRIR